MKTAIKMFLFSFIVFIFLGISSVSAGFRYSNELRCTDNPVDETGHSSKTCTLGFEIYGVPERYNKITASFHLENLRLTSFTATDGWYIMQRGENSYTLESSKSSFDIGFYVIANVTFYKIEEAQRCSVGFSYQLAKISRVCSLFQNKYYGKNGEEVNELTYQKECEKHYCEILSDQTHYDSAGKETDELGYQKSCEVNVCKKFPDGTYFGSDGKETSELNYQKECEKNVCKKLSDGTYYDKEGNQTNQSTYEKECKEHVCEVVDGTYFGRDGKTTNELTYQKECEKHYCEVLSDNTYYDSTGEETTKIQYEKECEKHVCEVLEDGTMYGKDGEVVSELAYEKECKAHYCETLSDGTKYDPLGQISDDLTYQKECEENYCKVLSDGTMYGKDGLLVDEKTYYETCETHYCEQIGDLYFDVNGNAVDLQTYETSCNPSVENPQTGASIPVFLFCISVVVGGLVYRYALEHRKFY